MFSILTMGVFLIQYNARLQQPIGRPSGFKEIMFLIAGVQPKTRRVEENPTRCPSCGQMSVYRTRVDHYLSLFFIPLIRVKRGEPFLLCEGCRRPVDGLEAPTPQAPPSGAASVCVACGKTVDGSFKYCPHCGQRA
jgi:predicted RNA-binding Zn-ribbon protein involved in translation (DUF1610 family)